MSYNFTELAVNSAKSAKNLPDFKLYKHRHDANS
jgi:hypothetical protein